MVAFTSPAFAQDELFLAGLPQRTLASIQI
jgi:hypothetical protein